MNAPPMYKLWEYNQFMDFIKDKNLGRAIIYAKTLGIDRRTLKKWLSKPELAEPLTQALDALLMEMQRAGKDDWRMYKELYNMIGLDDIKNIDVTSDGERLPTVIIESTYGSKPNFRIDNQTTKADELAEGSNSEPSQTQDT